MFTDFSNQYFSNQCFGNRICVAESNKNHTSNYYVIKKNMFTVLTPHSESSSQVGRAPAAPSYQNEEFWSFVMKWSCSIFRSLGTVQKVQHVS